MLTKNKAGVYFVLRASKTPQWRPGNMHVPVFTELVKTVFIEENYALILHFCFSKAPVSTTTGILCARATVDQSEKIISWQFSRPCTHGLSRPVILKLRSLLK